MHADTPGPSRFSAPQSDDQLRHTEKMIALGELVAGVAHEINNPLTGISAFAQMLLEDELTEDQRESVQVIKQEVDRAKHIITDLLLFSRATGRGTGPVRINDLLAQTIRLRAYPLRNVGVEVQFDLDPSNPAVTADAQQLQQVMLNVVSNAEQAMHGRATRVLRLRTRVEDAVVRIAAQDTGNGMAAEVRRRLFEPFFTTRPEGHATGLGMSVSYGIIQAHGGTIDVDSEPEVGTTITIALPAVST
jgi:two-component system NtrC family sensor kinase